MVIMIISFIYLGRAFGARVDGASPRGLCRRVVFASLRGQGERFLGLTGLMAGGFLGLTALQAEGCGGASHQRGIAFPRPQGGYMVFAAKGGIKNDAEGACP